MIADHLAKRIWHDITPDHKVEVWMRHDNKYIVSRLERIAARRWRETDKVVVDTPEEAQTWAASFTKGWTR